MKQKGQGITEDVKLPHFYRWLLRIPLPDFFGWLGRLPLLIGLLMYGLTLFSISVLCFVPIAAMVFTYPLVGFPSNVILGLSIPAIFIIFWARTQIERVLNFWKSLQAQTPQRNIEEVVKEYLEIVNKQPKKRKT